MVQSTLPQGLRDINACLDQGLFELAWIEAIELLLAYEHQGNSLSALALKLNESPVIAFNVLFAESYTLLPQKNSHPMAMRTLGGRIHGNPGCGSHWASEIIKQYRTLQ